MKQWNLLRKKMDVWQGLYDLKMEQDIFVGMTLSVCVGVIDV